MRRAFQRLEDVRRRSREITQVQAVGDDVRLKRGSGIPDLDADDDYYFRVETEPPSRERLFQLASENKMLQELEDDFRERDPNQVFMLPQPLDNFNVPDAPTLGSLWYQNRATGQNESALEHRGEMSIIDGKGVFSISSRPEAAIMNEVIGSSDAEVDVDMELGTPQSDFGVILRADDPSVYTVLEAVDQIKVNSFYYVMFTGTTVEARLRIVNPEEGKVRDTSIQKKTIPLKTKFHVKVYCFGNEFRVFRDGVEVLTFTDDTLKGEFFGVIGGRAVGQATTFDDFSATRYGGPYQERAFAQSTSLFRGSNVHYNPLYFEQVSLERYGHHLGNVVHPVIAQGAFFGDLMFLPYSVGKSPPWTCHDNQNLGKPGDVILPFRVWCPPWDKHGAIMQAGSTALIFSLLP